MKRLLTLITILVISCVNFVLVGYSTFFFNTSTSLSPNIDIAVNNIKQNYGRTENQNDYYDVYFFPQPRFAEKSDPLTYVPGQANINGSNADNRNSHGTGGVFDGYWNDMVTSPSKIVSGNSSTFNNNNLPIVKQEAFQPRKIENVYKRLTLHQLQNIGEVMTAMVDKEYWTYNFAGWTASKTSAINNGYGGMANLDLLDPFVQLSELDKTNDDGSDINDHIIYVYPIFVIGKDYSLSYNNQPSSVVLNGGADTNYVPYEQDKDLYMIKNIPYTEQNKENNDKFTISIDLTGYDGWMGGDSEPVDDTSMLNLTTNLNESLKNLSIIDDVGYYNVYLSIKSNIVKAVNLMEWINYKNTGYIDSGENYDLNDKNYLYNKISKDTSNIIFSSYGNGHFEYSSSIYNHTVDYSIWICVERVYEYKIIGGPSMSFDYTNENSPLLFKLNETTSTGQNQYKEYYEAQNVFFNSEDSFRYKHIFEDGTSVTNAYRETMFTIAASNQRVDYKVTFDDNPEINNTLDPEEQYGGYLRKAIGGQTISNSVDYTFKESDYLADKGLCVTEPGYYDLHIVVTYGDDENIQEITVSARKVSNVTVYIKFVEYNDNGEEFNRIQPASGENFIDINLNPFKEVLVDYYGSDEKYYYTTDSIDINTTFSSLKNVTLSKIDLKTNSVIEKITVNDLLNKGYKIIDHTTGSDVDFEMTNVVRLSHIFYFK